jgi:hypothetical protein
METIRFVWRAHDAFGNRIRDFVPKVSVQVVPRYQSAAEVMQDPLQLLRLSVVRKGVPGVDYIHQVRQLRFLRGGVYVLTASAKTPQGTMISHRVRFRVDGRGPVISLRAPERSSFLRSGEDVQVWGRVKDLGSGLARLTLNQRPLTVGRDGTFRGKIRCFPGLQTLVLRATDLAGNVTLAQRTISCFAPPLVSNDKKSSRPSVLIRFRQRALDDGKRNSLNDVASLLQYVANRVEPNQVLPPVIAKGKFAVTRWGPFIPYWVKRRGKVKWRDVMFSVKLEKDSIILSLRLFSLRLPLEIQAGVLKQQPLVLAPLLTFHIRLMLALEKGKLVLRVKHISNDASYLRIQGLSGAVGWLRGVIERNVRKQLQSGMAGLLRKHAFPVARRMLLSLQMKQTWRMPKALGKKPLHWSWRFVTIKVRKSHLKLALRSRVRGGSAKRVFLPAMPTTSFAWPASDFVAAFSFRTINEFLFALWKSGALQADLTKVIRKQLQEKVELPFPLPQLSLLFGLALPPLFLPGDGASSFRLVVGGAGIRIGLFEQQPQPFRLKATFALSISFRIVSTNRGLLVLLDPEPSSFSMVLPELKGAGGLAPAAVSLGVKHIVEGLLPDLVTLLLKRIPLTSGVQVRLPGRFRSWLPGIRVLPKVVKHEGGYVIMGWDLAGQ